MEPGKENNQNDLIFCYFSFLAALAGSETRFAVIGLKNRFHEGRGIFRIKVEIHKTFTMCLFFKQCGAVLMLISSKSYKQRDSDFSLVINKC